MRGTGPLAEQIEQTFRVFAKRYGLDGDGAAAQPRSVPPAADRRAEQLPLF